MSSYRRGRSRKGGSTGSCWAVGGLFFSLGAQLPDELFGTSNAVVGALAGGLLGLGGAISQLLFHRVPARVGASAGSFALAAGMVLIVLVCSLTAPPGTTWQLMVYPLWMALTGATFFGLGSTHWGGLYACAILCFALALVMPLRLELAPLAMGAAVSFFFLVMGWHLRGLREEAS